MESSSSLGSMGAVLRHWLPPHNHQAKLMLAQSLDTVASFDTTLVGKQKPVVFEVESMDGHSLATVQLSREEATQLTCCDWTDFVTCLRAKVIQALAQAASRPHNRNNLNNPWSTWHTQPFSMLVQLESEAVLLKEYQPDSHQPTSLADWLLGGSLKPARPLLRVVPVENGAELRLLASKVDGKHMGDKTFLASMTKLATGAHRSDTTLTPFSLELLTAIMNAVTSTTYTPLLGLYRAQLVCVMELLRRLKHMGKFSQTICLFNAMCRALTEMSSQCLDTLATDFTPAVLAEMLDMVSTCVGIEPINSLNIALQAMQQLFRVNYATTVDVVSSFVGLVELTGLGKACISCSTNAAFTSACSASSCSAAQPWDPDTRRNVILLLDLWVEIFLLCHDAPSLGKLYGVLIQHNAIGQALVCLSKVSAGSVGSADEATKLQVFIDVATKMPVYVRRIAVPASVLSYITNWNSKIMDQVRLHLLIIVNQAAEKPQRSILRLLVGLAKRGLFAGIDAHAKNVSKNVFKNVSENVVPALMDIALEQGPKGDMAGAVLCKVPADILKNTASMCPAFVDHIDKYLDVVTETKKKHGKNLKNFVARFLLACKGTEDATNAAGSLMTYMESHDYANATKAQLKCVVKLAEAVAEVAPKLNDRSLALRSLCSAK